MPAAAAAGNGRLAVPLWSRAWPPARLNKSERGGQACGDVGVELQLPTLWDTGL